MPDNALVNQTEGKGDAADGAERMKVITLTQPWATLIAISAKHIETRSWRTPYTGPLAIHAAAGARIAETEEICCSPVFREALLQLPDFAAWYNCRLDFNGNKPNIKRWQNRGALPFGAIVATCRLTACVPTEVLDPGGTVFSVSVPRLSDQELQFGDFSKGRWGWLLEDIKMLPEPIPAKGALGLWEWNPTAPATVSTTAEPRLSNDKKSNPSVEAQ